MKNLDQIRAKNALKAGGDGSISGAKGGEVIKKVPALVLNHGLLAAGAYGYSNDGHKQVFNHIAGHLADPDIAIVPKEVNSAEKLLAHLAEADSDTLRRATAESLAWLQFARRFIKK